MSNGAFLRYFCRVTPHPGVGETFDDLSFAYFLALKSTGTPIRVLATNFSDMGAPDSRWEAYTECFMRSVPKHYINVICGDNGELIRLYTVGTKNVAITATYNGLPQPDEVVTLQLYDAVLCPSEGDAEALRGVGITAAMHVAPVAATLASLLRGFI